MIGNKKIGLALSGGGYRAAAFHLGTLKKLHKLNLLQNIDFISTISGGSIIGAYYGLHGKDFAKFEKDFKQLLQKSIIGKIIFSLEFLVRILLIIAIWIFSFVLFPVWVAINIFFISLILIGIFFFKIFPTTKLVSKAYKKLFYKDFKLNSIPKSPGIVMNSTNLDTGTLLSFTSEKVFDSTYKYQLNKDLVFNPEKIEIAKAIAASTAVPYAFSPTYFTRNEFFDKKDYDKVKPTLVDGGLYDNQGIYRLTKMDSEYKCDIVIVSDGSYPFKKKFMNVNPLPVLGRVSNVLMNRIKNFQFIQNIYASSEEEIYEIGYFSLNWEYENCVSGFVNALAKKEIRPHLIEIQKITDELIKDKTALQTHLKTSIGFESIVKDGLTKDEIFEVSSIGTNLKALSDRQIELLTRHAEVLTEIQVRLYCPSLFN
ncbi:MAG: hypothetical protein DAHOPDDO_00596 [Ignavibacteriaceae bacterium]|nr:hypothetical protein [Ignavibacteriaceae bacterium]MCC6448022.1 patatin-like phospholipase family protein [Chitinophagaceae bacterium]